jgi:hypothetical protein
VPVQNRTFPSGFGCKNMVQWFVIYQDDPSELLQCKEEVMLPDEPKVSVKQENLLG